MSSLLKKAPPKFGAAPGHTKAPRATSIPNVDYLKPEFRTDKMDNEGPWGWSRFDPTLFKDILEKILECQKLTWQELNHKGSHLVNINQIISTARKRLVTLQLDDRDELYSLRLSNKQRIWGVKEGNIFWILWWDPNHEICPSHKKNT